ncbi:hypothetical protein GCM10023185_10960 [Hymenobacter saemangeumensis]|uniref:DUF4397 domain-containing protein n=1 Tax=Hymenobacter saemangeumensis TaxID=1084522 RepID=A0ABP8I5W3_9BACT
MKTFCCYSLFLAAGFSLALASCKKDDATTPSTPASTTPTAATPSVRNVHGALISLRLNYAAPSPVPTPVPVTLTVESGLALFYNLTPTAYLDAGAVTVNGNALDKGSNNTYSKVATPTQTNPSTELGFSNGSNWSIAGSGSVTAFNYNHSGSMPNYSGTLPTAISKANGLTVALSTVSNADSVYVLIAAGNQSVLKRARAGTASITFTANDLRNLPTVSDKSAVMQVLPFKILLATLNSKPYAFIKEYAAVGNVNIE